MVNADVSSYKLWDRSRLVIPGGVNSPVRAMSLVGLTPPFIKKGYGCRVEDIDGNCYIDYVGSWGPLILGHAHPEIISAINMVSKYGTSFGAPTKAEVFLAEELCEVVPSLEQVRLVNSGTEATMSAVRLARAFTGRDFIIKFAGCYHGHADIFLGSAGSGLLVLDIPFSPGVPVGSANFTLTLPYNNSILVKEAFQRYSDQIAAVIVEPVAGNMGVIVPSDGFLANLRVLCNIFGALLIFDEVITGFRVALGGAQERFGIIPDLTCLGKIIGGGLPIGAYGGRREIMRKVAPIGSVYQAGTLSGNPLATVVGLKMIELLKIPYTYETLEKNSAILYDGLDRIFDTYSIPHYGQRVGSMFTFFYTKNRITDLESINQSDAKFFTRYYQAIIKRGIYLAPSQFEATMISLAHDAEAIGQTLAAIEDALEEI